MTTLNEALKIIRDEFRGNYSFAWQWHSSLADCAQGEGMGKPEANRVAARFMLMVFGIDTSMNKRFANTQLEKI